MAEYIERQAAVMKIAKNESQFDTQSDACYAVDLMFGIPSCDVAEVRHKRWIVVRDNNNYPVGLKCSGCGRKVRKRGENYCPECGARMDRGWIERCEDNG